MLDQVSGDHIQQAFGDEANYGSQQIGAGGNTAKGEAEINDVGGDDVYGAAEDHSP